MEQKQQQAYNLFFQTELTQQQIADLIDVNRKTLYTWIKQGSWMRAKYAARHAPCILMEQYYAQLAAMNDHILAREDRPYPTKEESDIMRKLSATIKQVRPNDKKTIGENIELFVNFTEELGRQDRTAAGDVMPHIDKYINFICDKGSGLNYARQKDIHNQRRADEEYETWLAAQNVPSTTVGADPCVRPNTRAENTDNINVKTNPCVRPNTRAENTDNINVKTNPCVRPNTRVENTDNINVKTNPCVRPNTRAENTDNINLKTNPCVRPNTRAENTDNINENTHYEKPRSTPQWGADGAYENFYVSPKTATTATSEENGNIELSTKTNSQRGGAQENTMENEEENLMNNEEDQSPKPLGQTTDDDAIVENRWGAYLEDHYKISQDPYITREGNITVIRHGSPLWGKRESIFF